MAVGDAQVPPGIGLAVSAGPWEFDTAEHQRIRVSVVARGLSHPRDVLTDEDDGALLRIEPVSG